MFVWFLQNFGLWLLWSSSFLPMNQTSKFFHLRRRQSSETSRSLTSFPSVLTLTAVSSRYASFFLLVEPRQKSQPFFKNSASVLVLEINWKPNKVTEERRAEIESSWRCTLTRATFHFEDKPCDLLQRQHDSEELLWDAFNLQACFQLWNVQFSWSKGFWVSNEHFKVVFVTS